MVCDSSNIFHKSESKKKQILRACERACVSVHV